MIIIVGSAIARFRSAAVKPCDKAFFFQQTQVGTNGHFGNAKRIRQVKHQDAAVRINQLDNFITTFKRVHEDYPKK